MSETTIVKNYPNNRNQSRTRTSSIEKYLDKYAEKEVFLFNDFSREFSHVVTIPALDESIENINRVLNSIQENNVLVILIVNSQENSSDEKKISNKTLIDKIKNDFVCTWKSRNNPSITLHKTKNSELLLIDRNSKGLNLPSKTGVGLARKIAGDIALKLILRGNLKTEWIHCTDADVILPANYFGATQKIKNSSAAIYPYTHRENDNNALNKKSLTLYEISLVHYVIGLQFAKSNHAYHTIGSTIAVHFEDYANVRGFPARESGEDFYMLNKLSKAGKIKKADSNPIIIDGRISNRTPFGTGKSVEKISQIADSENNFLFYHPSIFEELKFFIFQINNLYNADNKIFIQNKNNFFDKIKSRDALKKTLEKIGAFEAIDIAYKSSKNIDSQQKHLTTWFDGFRTLKFIHQMRDLAYPSMPLKELIKQPLYESLNLSENLSLDELLSQFKELCSHLTSETK